jgi:hypothetical protein
MYRILAFQYHQRQQGGLGAPDINVPQAFTVEA